MITFPIRAEKGDDARFAYLVDATGRIFSGGGSLEDAEQLVKAANAGARTQAHPLGKQPRGKNKRQQLADELRESDILAKEMERKDIVYGHHDCLPQCGENVARIGQRSD